MLSETKRVALCVREVREHVVPRRHRAGLARLPGIADQRHRTRRAPAGQHPPLHRGEVLGLVDEHVSERAGLERHLGRGAVPVRRFAEAGGEGRGIGEAAQTEIVDDALRGVVRVAAAVAPAHHAAAPLRPGPRSESASSTSARSASVHGARVTSGSRRRWSISCSSSVRIVPDADRTSARKPNRSLTSSAPGQHRPHAFERFLHLGPAAEARTQFLLPALGDLLAARERARDRGVERGVAVEDARDVVGRGVDAAFPERADRGVLVTRDEEVVEAPRHVEPVLVVCHAPATRALDHTRGVGARQAHAQTRRSAR